MLIHARSAGTQWGTIEMHECWIASYKRIQTHTNVSFIQTHTNTNKHIQYNTYNHIQKRWKCIQRVLQISRNARTQCWNTVEVRTEKSAENA